MYTSIFPKIVSLIQKEFIMPTGQYRIISVGPLVGGGIAGSKLLNISAVAKTNSIASKYCIANELICSRIGQFLCLPLPPSGIVVDASVSKNPEYYFAALNFNLTGSGLPPVDPAKCVSILPKESTGLILFDILIANGDRHGKNFSVNFFGPPPKMNIFDHTHALLGYANAQGLNRLEDLKYSIGITEINPTYGTRHCLLDFLHTDEYIEEWISRIEKLPDFLIADVCDEATQYGIDLVEAESVKNFLAYRRDAIRTIVSNHSLEFKNIKHWIWNP
jgi:hypothetical protein